MSQSEVSLDSGLILNSDSSIYAKRARYYEAPRSDEAYTQPVYKAILMNTTIITLVKKKTRVSLKHRKKT